MRSIEKLDELFTASVPQYATNIPHKKTKKQTTTSALTWFVASSMLGFTLVIVTIFVALVAGS